MLGFIASTVTIHSSSLPGNICIWDCKPRLIILIFPRSTTPRHHWKMGFESAPMELDNYGIGCE